MYVVFYRTIEDGFSLSQAAVRQIEYKWRKLAIIIYHRRGQPAGITVTVSEVTKEPVMKAIRVEGVHRESAAL